ncbi:hypothetical protein [Hyphomonas sp. UBA4494]|jgi:hypothetical protein|uniref:hypothetical protein n=1 Tax=Hyphomonas sp. UBA4494 TaxID=1946631 RepID=UPI0025C01FC8|nr:hypothetical protein [Hyphomonas sp. UBA4494]
MTDMFPNAPRQISLDRQIECATREVAMRKKVYARRVADNRMPQAKADNEIATMEAIVETLRGLK